MERRVIGISDVAKYVKALISRDGVLEGVWVRGEISNFTNHVKSGHFYFSLKDESCSIRAIMFRPDASKLQFMPENGMSVLAFCSVRLFERDSVVQLYCTSLEPEGVGALQIAFEQRKQKLEAEGLFDPAHKKPIPRYPQKVGVVTSKTGAALQDILNILRRRYPAVTVVLSPALVQGENAPASIARAIMRCALLPDLDVMIVGRGGGSIEDLWAFNSEEVARAIFDCRVPVISAVGHETDFTIADFVADLRAPTPSAAAELAVPELSALHKTIDNAGIMLYNYSGRFLQRQNERLTALWKAFRAASPAGQLRADKAELRQIWLRLGSAARGAMAERTQTVAALAAKLDTLSPLKVLSRGYTITYLAEHTPVQSASQVKPGERLTTLTADGTILSEVIRTDGSRTDEI